jgi:hypothetical protein
VAQGIAKPKAESAHQHQTKEDQQNGRRTERDLAVVLIVALGPVTDLVLVFFVCGSHRAVA